MDSMHAYHRRWLQARRQRALRVPLPLIFVNTRLDFICSTPHLVTSNQYRPVAAVAPLSGPYDRHATNTTLLRLKTYNSKQPPSPQVGRDGKRALAWNLTPTYVMTLPRRHQARQLTGEESHHTNAVTTRTKASRTQLQLQHPRGRAQAYRR